MALDDWSTILDQYNSLRDPNSVVSRRIKGSSGGTPISSMSPVQPLSISQNNPPMQPTFIMNAIKKRMQKNQQQDTNDQGSYYS